MFVIKPNNGTDWQEALFMLSYYHVQAVMYSDGENEKSAYMVVDGPVGVSTDGTTDDQVRLAEMCFQMIWRQGGMVCHHCEKEEATSCGHLTFVEPINSDAFDKLFGM
jgi:hypothetical protein